MHACILACGLRRRSVEIAAVHMSADLHSTWGRIGPGRLTTRPSVPNQKVSPIYRQGPRPLPTALTHSVTHMVNPENRRIILASGSAIRATLLRNAGLAFETAMSRIDEEAVRAALDAEGAGPRDVADTLAEMKARKVSERNPGALVIGCDQVLDHDGQVLTKPDSEAEARAQLLGLRGKTHRLLAAAVVIENGEPLWRHVGIARLTMREFSPAYLDGYLARTWPGIRASVGSYQLESEGVRLFSRIEGDYFTILGLPLIELLTWLSIRGDIAA